MHKIAVTVSCARVLTWLNLELQNPQSMIFTYVSTRLKGRKVRVWFLLASWKFALVKHPSWLYANWVSLHGNNFHMLDSFSYAVVSVYVGNFLKVSIFLRVFFPISLLIFMLKSFTKSYISSVQIMWYCNIMYISLNHCDKVMITFYCTLIGCYPPSSLYRFSLSTLFVPS